MQNEYNRVIEFLDLTSDKPGHVADNQKSTNFVRFMTLLIKDWNKMSKSECKIFRLKFECWFWIQKLGGKTNF